MASIPDTTAEALLTFDWTDGEDTCSTVVMAVSAVSGKDPMAMKPLSTVIDPDALAMLFAPTQNLRERVQGRVEFEYDGYRVVIKANGRGYIYDADGSKPTEAKAQREVSVQADD